MTFSGWNILIAGGSGFIGRHLIPHLLDGNARVYVLTRHPRNLSSIPGVEYLSWDGVTSDGWGFHVEKMDAVINLVGESLSKWPWSDERLRELRKSRVIPTKALVDAIQASPKKPRVFIQGSAIGYYGNTADTSVDEASPPGTDPLARIVMDWEASSQELEKIGIRRPVIRTALVLDAHDGVLPIMALPFKLFIGGPIGSGNQWVPWIHIDDEVKAILYLLEEETANGSYVLSSPNPVQNVEFGKALAKSLDRPYWFPAPAFILRLVLGRMSMLVLEGQRPKPTRLLLHDFSFKYPDIQTALDSIYKIPVKL